MRVPRILGAFALLTSVISAAGFAVLSPPAQSTPEYQSQFNAKYDMRGGKLDQLYSPCVEAGQRLDPQAGTKVVAGFEVTIDVERTLPLHQATAAWAGIAEGAVANARRVGQGTP